MSFPKILRAVEDLANIYQERKLLYKFRKEKHQVQQFSFKFENYYKTDHVYLPISFKQNREKLILQKCIILQIILGVVIYFPKECTGNANI